MVSAYSIGKAQRNKKHNDNPGPGTYQHHDYEKYTNLQYRVGTEPRDTKTKTFTPGPGEYHPTEVPTKANKFTIPGKPSDHPRDHTPGPGHYTSLNLTTDAPKFTMTSRRNLPVNTSTPGPGTYNSTNNYFSEMPSYKMTQSKRGLLSHNTNPGPGSYNAISRPKSSAPQFGFGSSTRHGLNKPSTPGPGSYNHSFSTLQRQYAQTISGKRQIRQYGKDNPGPGAYNPQQKSKKSQGNIAIGQAKRDNLPNKQLLHNPGPGTYSTLNTSHVPNCKIGQEPRGKMPMNQYPGPGNYSIPSRGVEGPKFAMGTKSYFKRKEGTPGPGSYQPNHTVEKQNAPANSFGRSGRDQGRKEQRPGPGEYNQRVTPKQNQPKYSFGNEGRVRTFKSETPGPGSYNIPAKFNDVPKYLLNK